MQTPRVLVLATLDTKAVETGHLVAALERHGLTVETLDIGLNAKAPLDADGKLAAMAAVAEARGRTARERVARGIAAVVGLGGGTGGEIALAVLRALPPLLPKVLVTTLPFDPRGEVADTSIVLVPSLVDIAGLNPTLRRVLDQAAAMVAGLAGPDLAARELAATPTVGVSALGVTAAGVDHLRRLLAAAGEETTVFHANGYGGAALARWADLGALKALVDYTPHELTRIELAGAHVPMPRRFRAAAEAGIPIVVVPGALNIIGLGPLATLSAEHRRRPHYAHSALFTHVAVTYDEMVRCARVLAAALAAARGPVEVVVPLAGFSSQDRPGGAVEQPAVRAAFLDTMRRHVDGRVRVTALDGVHVDDEACARACLAALGALIPEREGVSG